MTGRSSTNLGRFLNPKSIAIYGGGWAKNVIEQLQRSNYQGEVWPVHPQREEVSGVRCFKDTDSLPGIPDASFIGVNREQTVSVVSQLSALGAGGAICFASGFRESSAASQERDLQSELTDAAGSMPILGPNCYGFLNYVDNVCLWPDQHGGQAVDGGVAIIAQSSNVAINMTMQQRGLSITHMVTVGNQAQIGVSEMAIELLADSRVNAIGLYLEGFSDIRTFERMALLARQAGKPLVALKIGKSVKAQAATLSHTATLAGGATASSAFLQRLGIVEVNSVTTFLETLKLLNGIGPLKGPCLSSVSCSGGEASLMADLAEDLHIVYPDLSNAQQQQLRSTLGEKVDLANPLDYHTYIWGDLPTMSRCFEAVLRGSFDLNVFVLDIPRRDVCDPTGHDCAIDAIISAKLSTKANVAVIALLPENLNDVVAQRFLDAGVVPLHGMETGLAAIDAAIRAGMLLSDPPPMTPVLLKESMLVNEHQSTLMDEYSAKSELTKHGLPVPASIRVASKLELLSAAETLGYPLVLKGLGLAHKTEAGAVVVGIESAVALTEAASCLPDCDEGYLLEALVTDVVAELLVGVTFDTTGLALLTIASGGTTTEILDDSASVVLPASREQLRNAVTCLKIFRVLEGFRGKEAANIDAMLDVIEAVARYVAENSTTLLELDINPLMVGTENSIVVDALIRKTDISSTSN